MSILIPAFIQIRLLDIIDILLVAILIYQLYLLIKGTGAMNIFLGILSIYLLWWLVRLFEMELLTALLGQFISVGVLALIIVFQPEIRRFLLMVGKRSILHGTSGKFLKGFWHTDNEPSLNIPPIVNALETMADQKIGALVVITKTRDLELFVETGQRIDALTSEQLLMSVFFKNSPLHDGAVIISGNRIKAARCVLPVSEAKRLPASIGLRHRSAIGVTEQSDAIALVVSEQTGKISWCNQGEFKRNVSSLQLKEMLAKEFLSGGEEHDIRKETLSFFSTLFKKKKRHDTPG